MTEEIKGCLDQDSYDAKLVPAGTQKSATLIIGDEFSPTIVKLVSDPRWGKAAYYPVRYHRHYTNPVPNERSEKNRRRHQCLAYLGGKCPECESFWDAYNAVKDLIKEGVDKDHPKMRAQEQIKSLYKPDDRNYILVVRPGSETVEAIQIGYKLTNALFGKKGNSGQPVETGLVESMKAKGRNPFDLKNPKGWIKLTKKGEGLDTEYMCTEAGTVETVTDENGDETERKRIFMSPVNPAIFKLTLDMIPEVIKLDSKATIWTKEEIEAYVKSAGGERPERAIYKPNQEATANADNSGDNSIPAFLKESLDPPPESATSFESDAPPFATETVLAAPPATTPKAETKKTSKPVDPLDDLV